MFKVRWWTPHRGGFSVAFQTKAEADASAIAVRKAGRNARVECAVCGEDDPDYCQVLRDGRRAERMPFLPQNPHTERCRCEDCVASASSILEMYGYDPAEMDMHRPAEVT